MIKVCVTCGVGKCLENFHKKKKSSYGVDSRCKQCKREHYLKNREKSIAEAKLRYNENREKRLAQAKTYYFSNKDALKPKKKKWYTKNYDRVKERKTVLKEKIKIQQKQYSKRHSAKISVRQKEYRRKNCVTINAQKKRHWRHIVDNLLDEYVIGILKRKGFVDPPSEMVHLQRNIIQLKREIKKQGNS